MSFEDWLYLNSAPPSLSGDSPELQNPSLPPLIVPCVFHSMTSSARASKVGGTSMLSAFATIRLTTRSNLVGCSKNRCERAASGISPGTKNFFCKKSLSHKGYPLWDGTIFGQVFGRGGMIKFSKWKVPLPGGQARC